LNLAPKNAKINPNSSGEPNPLTGRYIKEVESFGLNKNLGIQHRPNIADTVCNIEKQEEKAHVN